MPNYSEARKIKGLKKLRVRSPDMADSNFPSATTKLKPVFMTGFLVL